MDYFISALCLFVSSMHWSHFKGAANDVVQVFSTEDMLFYENNSPKFLHLEWATYISFQISLAWNFIFSWCLLRVIVLEMSVLTNYPHSSFWCAPQPSSLPCNVTLGWYVQLILGVVEVQVHDGRCWGQDVYPAGTFPDGLFFAGSYSSNHSFSA